MMPYNVFPVHAFDYNAVIGFLVARGHNEPMINRDGTPWDTVHYRRNRTDASVLRDRLNNVKEAKTLKARYDIYQTALVSLGLPYESFDTWLNR